MRLNFVLPHALCSSDQECDTCKGTACARCREGLFFDAQGFCSPCLTPNCATCANATTCTKCKLADFSFGGDSSQKPLLYLDAKTGTCKPCPGLFDPFNGPCTQCGSDGKCSRCSEGHYMDASKTCKPCADPLCKQCTANKCLRCYDSWYDPVAGGEYPTYAVYMDKSGTCKKCTANSYETGCTACDATGRCTKCGNHYGGTTLDQAKGKCVKCKDKLCSECSTSSPSTCIKCQVKPASKVSCRVGSSQLGEKHARPALRLCGAGCQCACSLPANPDGSINSCHLVDGLQPQAVCQSSRLFRTVPFWSWDSSDYGSVYKDPKTGMCTICKLTVQDGCRRCNNQGACVECTTGFFLSKKPTGCDQVLASGACHSCLNGYRPAAGNKCQKCFDSACVRCIGSDDFNCPKCDAARQWCTACPGYYGVTKDCKKCKDPLCSSCPNNASKCQSCGSASPTQGTYKDAQGRCRPCPEGCYFCDGKGVCKQCADGYGFKGKACAK
ncbi:hypothetical protein ABPG77_009619 [Micractinium sp. CCAP 211/92]